MTYALQDLRVLTRIKFAERHFDADHRVWKVIVQLAEQSFGGFCMKDEDEAKQLLSEICATFDVTDPEALAGRPCIALYSESPFNGLIDGLEVPSKPGTPGMIGIAGLPGTPGTPNIPGKRFTIWGWRARNYPDFPTTPTEAKRTELERDIDSYERRLAHARAALRDLKELVNWETLPPWRDP